MLRWGLLVRILERRHSTSVEMFFFFCFISRKNLQMQPHILSECTIVSECIRRNSTKWSFLHWMDAMETFMQHSCLFPFFYLAAVPLSVSFVCFSSRNSNFICGPLGGDEDTERKQRVSRFVRGLSMWPPLCHSLGQTMTHVFCSQMLGCQWEHELLVDHSVSSSVCFAGKDASHRYSMNYILHCLTWIIDWFSAALCVTGNQFLMWIQQCCYFLINRSTLWFSWRSWG